MFKWNKKGQIWGPNLSNTWMQEYGQNPNAVVLNDRIRIYFSSRKKCETNGGYISYIFYIDVDKQNPTKIIAIQDTPLLNPTGKGKEGSFDEFGTMPGSIIQRDNNEMWLYYVGWSRCPDLPYKWANGLAISKDGGKSFHNMSQDPIISSTYEFPYLHACPRVFYSEDSGWRMWYASGLEWYNQDGKLQPIYVLMSATSHDGIHWDLSGKQSIPSVRNKECQSSASVISLQGRYHMFFSFRDVIPTIPEHKQYRIGYAWSNDLINWHRDDSRAGINVSDASWDKEAVCYPHVVSVDDKVYMFYSGNQYGCAGFGYAELEDVK